MMFHKTDEITACIAMLCSDEARLLFGATIARDRGASAGAAMLAPAHLASANLLPT